MKEEIKSEMEGKVILRTHSQHNRIFMILGVEDFLFWMSPPPPFKNDATCL